MGQMLDLLFWTYVIFGAFAIISCIGTWVYYKWFHKDRTRHRG